MYTPQLLVVQYRQDSLHVKVRPHLHPHTLPQLHHTPTNVCLSGGGGGEEALNDFTATSKCPGNGQ